MGRSPDFSGVTGENTGKRGHSSEETSPTTMTNNMKSNLKKKIKIKNLTEQNKLLQETNAKLSSIVANCDPEKLNS